MIRTRLNANIISSGFWLTGVKNVPPKYNFSKQNWIFNTFLNIIFIIFSFLIELIANLLNLIYITIVNIFFKNSKFNTFMSIILLILKFSTYLKNIFRDYNGHFKAVIKLQIYYIQLLTTIRFPYNYYSYMYFYIK